MTRMIHLAFSSAYALGTDPANMKGAQRRGVLPRSDSVRLEEKKETPFVGGQRAARVLTVPTPAPRRSHLSDTRTPTMDNETKATRTDTHNAVVGLYETHQAAERAIKELERSGVDLRRLSIVGKGFEKEEHPVGFYSAGDRMKTWGGIGAFWGGVWGLLFGAALFWIPGLGPVAAAGPFVNTLVGALEGATVLGGAGALGAALASIGIPKKSVVKYETEVKANKYLLIIHGDTGAIEQARSIMQRAQASHIESYAA